jgi:hypothetical protein
MLLRAAKHGNAHLLPLRSKRSAVYWGAVGMCRTLSITNKAADAASQCAVIIGADDFLTNRQLSLADARIVGKPGRVRWSRLSEQIFRIDKWSACRG